MATRPRRAPRILFLEDRTVPVGQLDPTFSGDGIATAGLVTHELTPEAGSAAAVQPDGKVLVAGYATIRPGGDQDFAVYRYLPDGALDPTFGTGGKVTVDFGSVAEAANAVALQADGKIVLAGWTQLPGDSAFGFALARLNANGSLDNSFDTDGRVVTRVLGLPGQGLSSVANGVAIDGSGRIVAAGYTQTLGPEGVQVAVLRYTPAGALDTDFDTDGKAIFGSPQPPVGPPILDQARAVLIDASQRIVVAGVTAQFGLGESDFLLARLSDTGALDAGFGTNGLATADFGFGDAQATALVRDGTALVAVGYTSDFFGPGTYDFALARFLDNGTPDNNFDLDGKVTTDFGPGRQDLAQAAVLDGPRLVVAGLTSLFGTNDDFALARYNVATGALDATFGTGGLVTTDFGSEQDQAAAVAVLADGTVLAAGWSSNNAGDFALAKYLRNGAPDATFDADGRLTTNYGLIDVRGDDQGLATVVQADGKVIVGGPVGPVGDFGLARFNRDGTLDQTFGGGGFVVIDAPGFDQLRALAVQADGKIVAAGGSGDGFAVARFDANGNPDGTFDGDGRVLTPMPGGTSEATALTVQADGKIVVVGDLPGANSLAVARYLPDGRLDTTLDFDGRLVDPISPGRPVGVVTDALGRILVAGLGGLVRYLPDGRLDLSFDGDGRAQPDLGPEASIRGLALRPDGRIVVAGHGAGFNGTDDFALTQLLTNGAVDPAFGGGLPVHTDFGGRTDMAFAVRLQADGKIVLAGTSRSGDPAGNQFALARYNLNGTLDPTFDGDGKVTGTFGPGTDVAALFLQPNGKIDIAGSVDASGARDFAVAQFRGDNTLPTTTGIADFGVNEDAPARTFDLRALFDDAQDTDLELQFSVQNTNTGLVAATIDANAVLTLTFLPNRYGTATITVRATDLDGGFTDEPFTVTVASVNDLPVVVNDTANTTDQQPITVDVLANDSDADTSNPPPDTDVLTLVSVTGATQGTTTIVNNQVRYTPRVNTDGDEVLTYTVTDRFGATATGTLTIHVTDVTTPTVKEVRLYYTPNRYELLTDRIPVLAWSNVRKVQVVFSENVSVQQNDLRLTGLAGPYAFAGFNYNAATFTATWTLPAAIGIDRVRFALDGTTASGVSDVTAGNLIGSDVVRQFAVLPGDLDGDGLVTQLEADTVRKNLKRRYPNPRNADIDGDGLVTQKDYAIARANVGKRI